MSSSSGGRGRPLTMMSNNIFVRCTDGGILYLPYPVLLVAHFALKSPKVSPISAMFVMLMKKVVQS